LINYLSCLISITGIWN